MSGIKKRKEEKRRTGKHSYIGTYLIHYMHHIQDIIACQCRRTCCSDTVLKLGRRKKSKRKKKRIKRIRNGQELRTCKQVGWACNEHDHLVSTRSTNHRPMASSLFKASSSSFQPPNPKPHNLTPKTQKKVDKRRKEEMRPNTFVLFCNLPYPNYISKQTPVSGPPSVISQTDRHRMRLKAKRK